MYLIRINKSLYFDNLFTLEFYLFEILLLDNNILPGLVLIAFDNIFLAERLTGNLVLLFVTDRVVTFL
jgi:hypothetical protein